MVIGITFLLSNSCLVYLSLQIKQCKEDKVKFFSKYVFSSLNILKSKFISFIKKGLYSVTFIEKSSLNLSKVLGKHSLIKYAIYVDNLIILELSL